MNLDFLKLGSHSAKPRVTSPLVTADERLERECKTCKFGMPALHRNQENSSLPWRERGIEYECDNCKTVTYVANSNSVTIAIGSTIFIVSVIGILLVSGLLDYILTSLQTSIVAVLVSLVSLVVMAFALRYAWERIKRGAELIEGRIQHPMMNRKPGINMLNLSLTMGILPWLIAIVLGYVNQKYQFLQGSMIWLMAPIALLPIILGAKAGSTKMNVFLAAMFWLFIGGFTVWVMT